MKVNQSEVCQSDSVIYDTSAMNIYDEDGAWYMIVTLHAAARSQKRNNFFSLYSL